MSEKEEKLLEQIRETLNYHQIIWFDGKRFQLKGSKQELYQWLYCMRRWLNMAWQERIDNEVSPQTVKKDIR